MSPPPDGWPQLAATLHRVLQRDEAEDLPLSPWVTDASRAAASSLLARLRADAHAAIGEASGRKAAPILGVGRRQADEALAAGGWLRRE